MGTSAAAAELDGGLGRAGCVEDSAEDELEAGTIGALIATCDLLTTVSESDPRGAFGFGFVGSVRRLLRAAESTSFFPATASGPPLKGTLG